MPLYDYRCKECGNEIEVMHGIDGVGPNTCEVCGGVMKKALSTPAIHFKGSGWAKKDYQAATKAKAKSDKADVTASAKAGGKSEGGDGGGTGATTSGDADKKPSAAKEPAASSSTSTATTTSTAAD